MWAGRPHSFLRSMVHFLSRLSLALKEGGRLALLCRHAGSMWAGRPHSFWGPWFILSRLSLALKEGGRLALLCSHAGSNVGGSATLLLGSMVYSQPPVACFKGGRATRPPLQPCRIKCGRVAHTPFCGPWFILSRLSLALKEGGRLAFLCSPAGSMWAGRPHSFLRSMVHIQPPVACFKGGRATRPPL